MDFLRFNEQNFEEYIYNLNTNLLTRKKGEVNLCPSDFEKYNLGFLDVKIEQKGNVWMYCRKGNLKENIMLNHQDNSDCVFLFFSKKDSFSINQRTKKHRKYLANTHGVYFMNKNTLQETDIILKDRDIEDVGFQIPISYFEQLVNSYPDLFGEPFRRYQRGESFFLTEDFTPTTALHYGILSQIENSHLMGTSSNAYVDAKILELLSMCFQSLRNKKTANSSNIINYDKINEASFILTSNLDNPPSVRDLALQVGVNPNVLQSGFREFFHNTVYGYLFEYKMQLATQLLENTHKPIAEIAIQCGYEYLSHFCTAFKRRFGVTPKNWKQR